MQITPPSKTNSPKTRQRKERSRFSDEYGVLLDQLIAARKHAGITQQEVAHRLGKTQSHVSMCEQREREISIIDLWKWCGVLGISMSEFITKFEVSLGQTSKMPKK